MFEERMQQLMAERKNLNMRLAEINFLINGYETAIQDEKKNKKKIKMVWILSMILVNTK